MRDDAVHRHPALAGWPDHRIDRREGVGAQHLGDGILDLAATGARDDLRGSRPYRRRRPPDCGPRRCSGSKSALRRGTLRPAATTFAPSFRPRQKPPCAFIIPTSALASAPRLSRFIRCACRNGSKPKHSLARPARAIALVATRELVGRLEREAAVGEGVGLWHERQGDARLDAQRAAIGREQPGQVGAERTQHLAAGGEQACRRQAPRRTSARWRRCCPRATPEQAVLAHAAADRRLDARQRAP